MSTCRNLTLIVRFLTGKYKNVSVNWCEMEVARAGTMFSSVQATRKREYILEWGPTSFEIDIWVGQGQRNRFR